MTLRRLSSRSILKRCRSARSRSPRAILRQIAQAAGYETVCGFRDFGDPGAQFRLNRWLYALCRTGTDRPGVLFDCATTWLITQKVLLPAVTTLERHVARLRSRVEERVWSMLTAVASPETRSKLETLLTAPDGGHQSVLDRLRKGPYRRSAPELVRSLDRVEEIRQSWTGGMAWDRPSIRRRPIC
jgi:hypothetical protein